MWSTDFGNKRTAILTTGSITLTAEEHLISSISTDRLIGVKPWKYLNIPVTSTNRASLAIPKIKSAISTKARIVKSVIRRFGRFD
jgi:hypothetical protein